jgi:hypothetical protein
MLLDRATVANVSRAVRAINGSPPIVVRDCIRPYRIVYPKIVLQRWWGHNSRNILDKVKRADQSAVKKH